MDVPSTSPIQIGVPLDDSSPLFFACLLGAIWLIYLFSKKQFNQRNVAGGDDFVSQLLPRDLATPEEYSKGFMRYFGALAGTVLLLSLIGPKNLNDLGIPLTGDISYVIVPLAIAFVLIGVLPNIPVLAELEKWLRNYAYEQAYIPGSALATAERLSAAEFDFSAYTGDALQSPDMQGVEPADFTRPRDSLEHDWARLSCLVYMQKSRRVPRFMELLDATLLRSYQKDLQAIEDSRDAMVAEVAAYRAARVAAPAYVNDTLRRTIRNNLYKLYILLGCAVRLKKQPFDDIDLALRHFGFKLNQTSATASNSDLKIVCLAVVATTVLLIGFLAVGAGKLKLWTLSVVFPREFYQPFLDMTATLIPHIAAIMVADLLRRSLIKRQSWFGPGNRKQRAITANYIRVAAASGIAGAVSLILWGTVFQSPTVNGVLIAAPFALVAMATGGFYVYHLDNVAMDRRPPRFMEVGGQTLAAGLCGLIAASVSFDLLFGDAGVALDNIGLVTVTNAAVGFVLASYVPRAAAAAKHDPLTAAKQERLDILEAAAAARFGNAAKGGAWLETSHPALGGKSPKAAAADVDGFEHAMSLLQGPQAVAA